MSLIGLLCKVTQIPYSHLLFLPIIDKIVNDKNHRKIWSIVFLVVFWVWYLCEGNQNKITTNTGGLSTHLLFILASTFLISKLTSFSDIYRYAFSALISNILALKLSEYTTFLIPIEEIFGSILNPLMWISLKKSTSTSDYHDHHIESEFSESSY
jgi:hypothetical protein